MHLSPATKALPYTRALIAKALSGEIESFALQRWGVEGPAVIKAAVGAVTSADTGNEAAAEFFNLVREASLIGRLSGLRPVPWHVRMLAMTAGATGYWVAEHALIPLSKSTLAGAILTPLKVAIITTATRESLQAGGPVAEAGLQRDLVRAIAAGVDSSFIDAGNAGVSGVRPASVSHGAPQVAATGDPQADLAALVEAFGGDLAASYFITDPLTATQLALARDATGAFLFPDCGPRGGTLLGLPLLTTRGSPRGSDGQIALIDPTIVAHNMEDLGIVPSDEAMLLASDDPENDSEPIRISLFQSDTIAFKAVVRTNWRRQQATGVAVLTGANYAASET